MLFKKKPRITKEKAVLIEKKIINTHDMNAEITNLCRMRRGTYHVTTAKKTKGKAFSLIFMTKQGSLTFFVSSTTYYQIDLNSLGLLTRNKDLFKSFEIEKIATKDDVINLNW